MSRPEKPIDWKKVDDLLVAGCSGAEIAPHFDMHFHTFYDRVVKQFGVSFTDYAQEKRQKGESLLRAKQFEKAMKGDNMMLIWLGKNRLDQRDGADKNAPPPNDQVLNKLIEEVKTLRDKINAAEPKADTII